MSLDRTIVNLRLCFSLRPPLELLRERDVVEEDPRVIELAVPGPFQVANRGDQVVKFFVSYEGNERGVGAGRVGAVGGVVAVAHMP